MKPSVISPVRSLVKPTLFTDAFFFPVKIFFNVKVKVIIKIVH